jgi:hypothetical protein
MSTLALSPLTECEVYDRLARKGAEYAALALFIKHRVPAPNFIGDKSPRANRLRAEELARIEAEWLELDAAKDRRLFGGAPRHG